jgi:exodeoxyribonuclease-1
VWGYHSQRSIRTHDWKYVYNPTDLDELYDLSADPGPLLDLDAATIRERVFSTAQALPDGVERIPLKLIHTNKAPVVVPYPTLREEDAERLGINRADCEAHRRTLEEGPPLSAKLQAVFEAPEWETPHDPDLMIYSGGFFNDADRARMERMRALPAAQLALATPAFDDPRLTEMLFRYRARNYPESLNADEQTRWRQWRRTRLIDGSDAGLLTLAAFRARLAALRSAPERSAAQQSLLDTLGRYADELEVGLLAAT